ncbi:MAG: hypothetical protein ACK55V_11825 [Alphaproteobacteria bacterium]|jgi:hypothetical protein
MAVHNGKAGYSMTGDARRPLYEDEDFERVRVKAIETHVSGLLPAAIIERAQGIIEYSQYGRLLNEIAIGAESYALKAGLNPGHFAHVMERAIDVVRLFRFSVMHYEAREGDRGEKAQFEVWRHKIQLTHGWIDFSIPSINKAILEQCVENYLNLEFRSQSLDRLIVDALIAFELWAWRSQRLPVLIFTALPAVLLCASTFFFGGSGFAGPPWLQALGILMLGLGFTWPNWRGFRLLFLMQDVYRNLHSHGPISASFVLSRLRHAADRGVVWPAPLMALLDDINKRGGRF